MKKYGVLSKNPVFDVAVGQLAGPDEIPTKQDKFKPLIGVQGIIKESDGQEVILNELYVRNPDKDVVKRFEKGLRELLKESIDERYPILLPFTLEVVIQITVQQKRFFQVDVDNLAKTVLDCLTGIVFENDSQVINLLVQKSIHPFNIPGIFVGIRRIKDDNSLFRDINIYFAEETDEKPEE